VLSTVLESEIPKEKSGPIATIPFHADFYVAAATVIPVIFLALIVEGGLWQWITDQIMAGRKNTVVTRFLVSLLQLFALGVLLAGTVSEVLAIQALAQESVNLITKDIVEYSTMFLIILLGIVLLGKVPGVFSVNFSTISLEPEDGEEIIWSGLCARRALSLVTLSAWIWGKLYVTNIRVVWMGNRELGLMSTPMMEIKLPENSGLVTTVRSPGWTKHLPSNRFGSTPPQGFFFDVTTRKGKKYNFCTSEKEEEFNRLIETLSPISTGRESINQIRISGTGWPPL
jgi:hypothetical protein